MDARKCLKQSRCGGDVNGWIGKALASITIIVLVTLSLSPLAGAGPGPVQTASGSDDSHEYTVRYVFDYHDKGPDGSYLIPSTPHNNWNGVNEYGTLTVGYDGVAIAEYNPQFWSTCLTGTLISGTLRDWLPITTYLPFEDESVNNNTIVFTGWTDGTNTYDPGDDITGADKGSDGVIELRPTWNNPNIIYISDIESSDLFHRYNFLDVDDFTLTAPDAKYRNIAVITTDLHLGNLSAMSYYTNLTCGQTFTLRSEVGHNYDLSISGDPNEDWKPGLFYNYLYAYVDSDIIIDNVNLIGYGGSGLEGEQPTYALYGYGKKVVLGANVTCTNKVTLYGGNYGGNADVDMPADDTDLRVFSGNYFYIYGGSGDKPVNGTTNVLIAGDGDVSCNAIFGGGYNDGAGGTANIIVVGGEILDSAYPSTDPAYDEDHALVIGGSRNSEEEQVDSARIVLAGKATRVHSVYGDSATHSTAGTVTEICVYGNVTVDGILSGHFQHITGNSTLTVGNAVSETSLTAGSIAHMGAMHVLNASVVAGASGTQGTYSLEYVDSLELSGAARMTLNSAVSSLGGLTSEVDGVTSDALQCTDPDIRNEVVLANGIVLEMTGVVSGFTHIFCDDLDTRSGPLARGHAEDDEVSGFTIRDGSVKALPVEESGLKAWYAVLFQRIEIIADLTAANGYSWSGDAQLPDGSYGYMAVGIEAESPSNGQLRVVSQDEYKEYLSAGGSPSERWLASLSVDGTGMTTHTYSGAWVSVQSSADIDGTVVSLELSLLSDEAPGLYEDAGSVVLDIIGYETTAGGNAIPRQQVEVVISIGVETDAPQLDDEGLILETILVYISDADFGGSVQTGITGHSLTFQISVDGAVLSLVLSEDGMLTLPEGIAGTGALELWVTGQMCIVLVSVGTPSDYPGVIS